MVDLSVEIAGVRFPTCVFNASGPRCGAAEAMQKIAATDSGAVLSKSATLESQTGNPTPRIFHGDCASFNSEGLPNKGIDYYISQETYDQVFANDNTKPYIVSLSGKTMKDNLVMLKRISQSKTPIAAIELNLACPNIIGKPIIAYDVQQVKESLDSIRSSRLQLPPLGVKLAPYLDMVLLEDIAKVISSYLDVVQYVVTINTVGNTLPIDGIKAESPYIRANGGLAGMSGEAVAPIALANVWKLKQVLNIPIIGVGGIRTGQDAYNMLLAGASACQVGTTHWVEGPGCFDRIVKELREILEQKGHDSVASVVGNLKPWSATNRPGSRATVQKTSKATSDGSMYQAVSIVLAVVVAILLADKYNVMGYAFAQTMFNSCLWAQAQVTGNWEARKNAQPARPRMEFTPSANGSHFSQAIFISPIGSEAHKEYCGGDWPELSFRFYNIHQPRFNQAAMEAYALGGAACNVVGSPFNRALQTWIKKNWGLQEFVDSFLRVVKETEINFEVECNRLFQFNVRRAKNLVIHQGEDKQMLMRMALKKMYTCVRAFARVAQTFIENIAFHYRLSKSDTERLQSSIYKMNSIIGDVRSLVVDCIFECGGPSKDFTDLVQIKMVTFKLRGGIGAIVKGGGVTHLRRQGNAEQADSELAAFDDQLRTRRKEIGAKVSDLFELLDDIEMNHHRLVELQTKEVRESLTLEYNDKVKKIHFDYQEQVRTMAKSIRELEEEAELSKSALPEVENIQRAASEAIKKAEKEYKEKFLAKERGREMEHKAKMAKAQKEEQKRKEEHKVKMAKAQKEEQKRKEEHKAKMVKAQKEEQKRMEEHEAKMAEVEKFIKEKQELKEEHTAKMAKDDGSLFQLMTFAICLVLAVGMLEKLQKIRSS